MSDGRRTTAPVPEEPVRLVVNDRTLATWTATPAALDALAAGRLLTAGFVRKAADLVEIAPAQEETGIHVIRVAVSPASEERGWSERAHRAEHGCGLRFLVDCRPDLLPERDPRDPPPLDAFPELFRELFDRSPSRETTGGHHTAALARRGRLLHVHEEIGRHNAVDKVVGSALLAGYPMGELGLVTTARISGEISEKAARAGLAWIASRSVPTTLAVDIARAAGLVIVARAAGREPALFGASPERGA